MSRQKFDNECQGCRPVLIDPTTKKVLPDDAAPVMAINKVWEEATLDERQAFHRFTCLNSTTPEDLAVIDSFRERFSAALKE